MKQESLVAGKYFETDKSDGQKVVRYDTKAKYTKKELEAQRADFEREAKAGNRICISDLMINHGM